MLFSNYYELFINYSETRVRNVSQWELIKPIGTLRINIKLLVKHRANLYTVNDDV